MRSLFLVFFALGLFVSGGVYCNPIPPEEEEEEEWVHPYAVVWEMIRRDNALRKQWIYEKDADARREIAREIRLQEISHTQRLKEFLSVFGLPLKDEEDIEDVCKLILRSSDLDFQKSALESIVSLEDSFWEEWIPILTDRVLLRASASENKIRPTLYPPRHLTVE